MAATESKPERTEDRRKYNRGTKGNKGGRPPRPKTLLIDGIIQSGHYRLVAQTGDTLVLESVNMEQP